MNKNHLFLFIASVLLLSFIAFAKFGNVGTGLFPLIAVSALLDSINPCALSVLLLSIAFLFSMGLGKSRILQVGGVYILGIFIAYLFIGLGILQVLNFFNIPNFMGKVGAGLLIGFGLLNLANVFFPAFPIKLQIPKSAHQKIAQLMEKASILAAFFLGALIGLCEFPCTGGPYLMVLGLLHDQATYLKGLGYLVFYNLMFVLPLVFILLLASDKMLLERVQAWRKNKIKNMRLLVGVAMILLGIIIFIL